MNKDEFKVQFAKLMQEATSPDSTITVGFIVSMLEMSKFSLLHDFAMGYRPETKGQEEL